MLSARQKFQGKTNRLPKHQTCFSVYCVLPAPLRGVGKTYRSPCLPVLSPLPRLLMTLISFSFSLENTCWRDRCTRPPETERDGKPGGKGRGWHIHPKKPSSCAPLSTPRHPPITPSSASSFSSRDLGSRASQAFYFVAAAGEQQVPIAGIMYSKLSYCFFLIGQSPWDPLSLHPDGRGRGWWMQMACFLAGV